MGFFKKIFKGIKKVVKSVGKTVKKAVVSVGKFMDKIGIVGQIGLALIMPGIGQMLGQWAGSMMAYQGFGATVVNGAGQFLNAAVNVGTKVGNAFKTVTEGVTKVVGQTIGTTLNKVGLGDMVTNMGWDISKMTSFTGGADSVMGTLETAMSNIGSSTSDLFSMSTLTDPNKFIADSVADKATAAIGENLADNVLNPDALDAETVFGPDAKKVTANFVIPEGTAAGTLNQAALDEAVGTSLNNMVGGQAASNTLVTGAVNQAAVNSAVSAAASNMVAEGTKQVATASLLDRGVDYATNVVDQSVRTAVSSTVTQGLKEAVGLKTVGDINQTSYATVIPGMDDMESGPVFGQNVQTGGYLAAEYDISRPFGYGAAFDNFSKYQSRMQQFASIG